MVKRNAIYIASEDLILSKQLRGKYELLLPTQKNRFVLFTIVCEISLECISPYCILHFSLVHLVHKKSCSPATTYQTRQRLHLKSSLSKKLIAKAKMKQTLLHIIFQSIFQSNHPWD